MRLPEVLRTPRLVLRRPRPDDASAVYEEYARDPEVSRYLPWAPHTGLDDTHAFLAYADDGWRTGREYTWAITRGDDRVIGMISLRPSGHKADFGYALGRAHWGNGYMPEAAEAVVTAAFADPAMARVWAVCDVDNRASIRVLEKIGMQREGVLHAWLALPNISPHPRDAVVHARIRRGGAA